MKNRKLKTLLLGASAVMGSILISCSRTGLATNSKTEGRTKFSKKEQKYDIEQNKRIRQEYQRMYADSVRFANGYDTVCNKTNMLWEKSAELTFRADSLAIENSLGVVMQREVENAADKILEDFFKEVSKVLSLYNISLTDYLVDANDVLWCFSTNTQKNEYEGVDYVLKQPLFYFGVNTCGYTDVSEYEFDEFIAVINQIIDESNCDQSCKKEILNKVNALIKKTKPKLISSRKSIEYKYSDYYVVIDGQDPAFVAYDIGDWNYGYTDTEFPERQAVVKVTTLSVYNENLPLEFFGDTKAKYKLVNLGKNKWQVKKISRKGFVENTEVFTCAPEASTQEYYAGADVRDYSEFRFYPGQDRGVHIETEKGVVIKRAKSQWYPSKQVLNQIDSLDEQSRDFATQATKLEEQKKMINQYADSVANTIVNQRFR